MSHYENLSSYCFWSKALGTVEVSDVDPVVKINTKFKIGREEKVVSAGSCFAQRISSYLANNGFNYKIYESAHPILGEDTAKQFNYNIYSARYGNIYTARQLLQLFKRAFGLFEHKSDYWIDKKNNFVDPFRPFIQPNGFNSSEEVVLDRVQHLKCVREMFQDMDYFIFTLGLTECWISNEDGVAYPICPDVVSNNTPSFSFKNFTVEEVVDDISEFNELLLKINKNAKIVISVSPVPLTATAIDQHVLVSNTYSKAVLRVACEDIVKRHDNVCYFPSFEIIDGSFNMGVYFDKNKRTINSLGVSHVMRVLAESYLTQQDNKQSEPRKPIDDNSFRDLQKITDLICDEVVYDAENKNSLKEGT
jgi:hypothetical protein